MRFCENCDNMYYIKTTESNDKLMNYCRNCGHESTTIENFSVLKNVLSQSGSDSTGAINKYTKLDPTLPRVNNIKCPNSECITNKDGKMPEIIYIRYDEKNIKFIYLCSDCDTTWKINNID